MSGDLVNCHVLHSGAGEKNHKVFVKDSGQQTQRRTSSFTVQVADRVYEITIIIIIKLKFLSTFSGNSKVDKSMVS